MKEFSSFGGRICARMTPVSFIKQANAESNLDPTESCPEFDAINFYHNTMYIMFVIFVITMTIIVSNMLVGLAVDDIKAVQDTAVLQRQALKIKLALVFLWKLY